MPATRPTARTAAAAIALVVAAAVGAGLWWALGRDDPDRDCAGLRGDERVRTVLGATWRSDLSCGELADGLRRATAGDRPGSHTPEQARALRRVLLAVAGRPDHRVHPQVRGPLAAALADYAADTHAVLTGVNDAYLAHDAPDADVWQDGQGVHVAVPKSDLIDVLRGLSEDPAAYAVLRAADLRQGAAGLGAVGPDPAEAVITDPLVRAAASAGVFDGIADDVLRGRGDEARTDWRDAALRGLAPSGERPAFAADPAGHLAQGWLRQVAGAPDRFERLHDEAAALLALWTEASGQDGGRIGLPALQDRARTTTDRERTTTAAQLRQGGG
ncbi:hypothetical protein ACFVHB_28070 [Kitasatospora sp. NPDC127111]|uniref:hypothetical protein n=1 Tax=Kitasatospora sp. NPDC127111 TaxID=3345363 RepID=UPI0036442793